MALNRLLVFCVAVISFAATINSTIFPYASIKPNPDQARQMGRKALQLLKVKFDNSNPKLTDICTAMTALYEKEIRRLEKETSVNFSNEDMRKIKEEISKESSVTSSQVPEECIAKDFQMLALSFYNRDANNPPTPDEIVAIYERIIDAEIYGTNGSPMLTSFTLFGYTFAAVSLIVANGLRGV